MRRLLLKFSKKHYRAKLVISVVVLVLVVALVAVLVYKNFKVTADIQEPTATAKYLPQINFSQTDFFLTIDKISVKAPVIPNVDGANKDTYFASLQKGVAQMLGTAKPGEKGNIVIFGHSNFYQDDPGSYKQIFINLDKLQPGDGIVVHYQGKDYNYLVQKQEIVDPTDTWVISAPYDLTLLTCWPPGTVEKRLIIFANKTGD